MKKWFRFKTKKSSARALMGLSVGAIVIGATAPLAVQLHKSASSANFISNNLKKETQDSVQSNKKPINKNKLAAPAGLSSRTGTIYQAAWQDAIRTANGKRRKSKKIGGTAPATLDASRLFKPTPAGSSLPSITDGDLAYSVLYFPLNGVTDPDERLQVYYNGKLAPNNIISIPEGAKSVQFQISSKAAWPKFQVTWGAHWDKPRPYQAIINYINDVDTKIKSFNNNLTSAPVSSIDISKVISFLNISSATVPSFSAKLELLKTDGTQVNSISIPKNQKYIDFKLRYAQNGKSSDYWESKDIRINWDKTQNDVISQDFWTNTVSSSLKDVSISTPPKANYNLADIKSILGLPSVPTGLTDYVLLPETSNIISARTAFPTNDNQKELKFRIAYPKNGINRSSINDFNISNVLKISWDYSRNSKKAKTYWDNISSKITNPIISKSGVSPSSVDPDDILNLIGAPIQSTSGLSAKVQLFNNQGNKVNQLNISNTDKSVSFKLGFPKDGVNNSAVGNDLYKSNTLTLKWAKTVVENETQVWWNKIQSQVTIPQIMSGQPPATFDISDITSPAGKFWSQFGTWYSRKPSSYSSLRLYKGSAAANGNIQIPDNTKTITFSLKYPPNGSWSTGTPLSHTFTLTWAKSVNEINANNFWQDTLTKLPQAINKPGTAPNKINLAWLRNNYNIQTHPTGTGMVDLKLLNSSGNIASGGDISIPGAGKSVSFKLQYPKNGASGSGASNFISHLITITFGETKDQKAVKDWWNSMPSNSNINMGANTIAPAKIDINDFINGTTGAFKSTFATWYAAKPTQAADDPRLYTGATYLPTILSIFHNRKTVTISLKFPDTGNWATLNNGNMLSQQYTITWGYTKNEDLAKKFWDPLNAKLATTITPPGKTPPAIFDIAKVKSLLTGVTTSPPLNGRLEFINKVTGGLLSNQNLNILPNEDSITFRLRYPRNGMSSTGGYYLSHNVTISWNESRNEKDAQDYFDNQVKTKLAAKSVSLRPQANYSVSDIATILGIAQKPSNLSGNLYLLDATGSAVSSTHRIAVSAAGKTITFRIGYPKNGVSASSISDLILMPNNATTTITFNKSRNELDADSYWNNLNIPSTKSRPNTPNASYSIRDILSFISISNPNNLTGRITLLDKTSNARVASLSIPSDEKSVSFKIGFPKDGVNNSATGSALYISNIITIDWNKTVDEHLADVWWTSIPKIIPTVAGIPPTSFNLADLVSASSTNSNIFNSYFSNWFRSKPNYYASGNRELKLYKGTGTNNNVTSIPIDAATKNVTFTLKFPETGNWTSSSNPKTQTLTFNWNQTRNEKTAMDFWNKINSSLNQGANPSPQSPPNVIEVYPSAQNPISLSTLFRLQALPASISGKLQILDNRGKLLSPQKIVIDKKTKQVNFKLRFPKNGVSGSGPNDFYTSGSKGILWSMTRDQKAVADWWAMIPQNANVNLGTQAVAPGNIGLVDFTTSSSKIPATFGFGVWFNKKPSSLQDGLKIFVNGSDKTGQKIGINKNQKRITIELRYPNTGVWSTKQTDKTKQYNIIWGYTDNEKKTENYWNQVQAAISSATKNHTGAPAPTYTLGNAKTDFAIPSPQPSFLQNKLVINYSGQPSIGINAQTKNITFDIKIPRNGISGTIPGDFYNKTLNVSWTQTRDEKAVSDWFAKWQPTYSVSTYMPKTLNLADIKNFVGAAPATMGHSDLKIFNGSTQITQSVFTMPLDRRDVTFKFKFPTDGHGASTFVDKDITIKYTKSNNEYEAKTWFDSLSARSGIQQGAPLLTPNIPYLGGYINNFASKPAQITAAAQFTDQSGNIIPAPQLQRQDFALDFYMSIPSNGVSGTLFNPKRFSLTWAKTALEGTVYNWFQSIATKPVAQLPTNYPEKTYSTSQINNMLNIPSVPSLPTGVTVPLQWFISQTSPVVTSYNVSNADTSTFDIWIGVNAWDPARTIIRRKLQFTFARSRNNFKVDEWQKALASSKAFSNPTDFPKTTITYNDIKGWLGITSKNLPQTEPMASKDPIISTSATATSSIASINVDQNTKAETFYVRYYINGRNGTLSTAKRFDVTWQNTRQEYLNNLNFTNLSANIVSGGNYGNYTAKPAQYGTLTSHIVTADVPKTLAELKAQSGVFTSSIPNLIMTPTNVTNLDIKWPAGKGLDIQRSSDVAVRLDFLGAVKNIVLRVDYNNADIGKPLPGSNFQAQIDKITLEGNTNNSILHIPQSAVQYFEDRHLVPIILVNGQNHKWTINYDLNKIPAQTYDFPVPSGILQNNSSNNKLTFTLEVAMKPGMQDPHNVIPPLIKSVTKQEFVDIYIDTTNFGIWQTPNNPTGIIQITGTNTNNWGIREHIPNGSHYTIEYRFLPVNGTATAWSPATSFTTPDWWNQFVANGATNGDFTGELESRLVPNRTDPLPDDDYTGATQNIYDSHKQGNYVLSSDRQSPVDNGVKNSLLKVINYGILNNSSNGTAAWNLLELIKTEIKGALQNAPDTHHINWINALSAITNILNKNHISIKYTIEANPSNWSGTIPALLEYIHADRHLWTQVSANSGFEINGTNEFDLVAANQLVPIIKKLIGYIDKTRLATTTNKIDGLTNNGNITQIAKFDNNTLPTGTLPTGLKYEYSLTGAKWTDKTTFLNDIKDIHLSKADFQYRIVVTDPLLFKLSSSVSNKFDVSGLKTYIDISKAKGILDAGFSYGGQYGKGQSVEITSPPSALDSAELAQLRIKLQYKMSVGITTWKDMPQPIIRNGGKLIIIANDLIPSTGAPTIEYRFVPYIQDGPAPATSVTPKRDISSKGVNLDGSMTDYENYATAAMSVKTSTSPVPIVLPTVVTTPQINTNYFDFTGQHTKDFNITIKTSTIDSIKQANLGSNPEAYWNKLVYLFTIEDGSGSERYAFDPTTFVKWMHGDYATGSLPRIWEIANASGTVYPSQMAYNYVPLPVAHKVPDWNEIDMSSIKVRWGTQTTRNTGNTNTNYYIASEPTGVDISTLFINKVLKWFDVENIIKAVDSVYITGDTHSYVIDKNNKTIAPSNPNTNQIENAYLNPYGLKAQYSVDSGKTWSDTPATYNTWVDKIKRSMYMRAVPILDSDTSTPFVGNLLFLRYPVGRPHGNFNTNLKDAKGNRHFRVYTIADINDLPGASIEGTQFQLKGTSDIDGITETFDTDKEDYSQIEVQYLYGGKWYKKSDLADAILQNRQAKPGKDLASIIFPSDFSHGNVKVRWHLTGSAENYVMSSAKGSDPEFSIEKPANANALINFANIWNTQSENITKTSNTDHNLPKNNSLSPKGDLVTADYGLIGSLNAATMTLQGTWTQQYFNNNHIKVQYSTKENPSSQASNTSDWIDSSLSNNIIFDKVAINNHHKSLFIRFLSNDPNWVPASYSDGGNGLIVLPIKIDTSTMKFSITTRSAALASIIVGGDTQTLFTSTETDYLNGNTNGIDYKKQDPASPNLITVPQSDRAKWVLDNGITIRYQVVQTRTGINNISGKQIKVGDTVEFNTLALFKKAIASGNLNFDRSTLKVQWGILFPQNKTNQVTDAAWIAPSDVSNIVNVIYSHDSINATPTSVELTGNTIATVTKVTDQNIINIVQGLKIQYSLDQTTWTDAAPASIGGNKNLYIRLEPISVDYKLDASSNANQLTKIDSSKVYTAINIATNQSAWDALLNATNITGHTIVNSNASLGFTVNNQPVIPAAEDGQTKGHWEYTIDQTPTSTTIWTSNDLNNAIPEYKGSGSKGFDKDREDYYVQRYVLDTNEQTLPTGSGYMFTDASGIPILAATMQNNVDITGLTQYIYTDYVDTNLPITSTGLNMTWKQLGNEGKFLPSFIPSISGKLRRADYQYMQYLGQYKDANGKSRYKFDVNPYDPTDIMTRSDDNMLAPRHAHFEYRYTNTPTAPGGGGWQNWSKTLPINRPLESNFKPFEVRIVPDPGFEIPNNIFDKDNNGTPEDQNWKRKYPVVIIADTNGIATKTAQYVGFDSNNKPSGRFITDDTGKDYTKGNPVYEMTKNGTDWSQFKTFNAYVAEYNVLNSSGTPISWTDDKGVTKVGWHSSISAPSSFTPWRGDTPKTLKNGDIVRMRLRAKNGFVIDDSKSTNILPSGFAPWSSNVDFAPVSGLNTEIEIPTGYQIYDTIHTKDFLGQQITRNPNMPSVTFGGFESSGTISVNYGTIPRFSQNIYFKVQVLRPQASGLGTWHQFMAPRRGYSILDSKNQIVKIGGSPLNAMVTNAVGSSVSNWTYDWYDDIDKIADTWVDPASVNYLQVGDAIRIRTYAKTGFGFRWEDPDTSFTDKDITAKNRTQWASNTGGVMQEKGTPALEVTPLPVTGLLVKPPIVPSDVTLKYDADPEKRLQGNAYIEPSYRVQSNARWKFLFQIQKKGFSSWPASVPSIPRKLVNGDKVKILIQLKNGYKFDPNYIAKNIPVVRTVASLKDKIDSRGMGKPSLDFKGYEGSGEIKSITSNGNAYSSVIDKNGFPNPSIPAGGYSGKGIKWEYQIAKFNPNSAGSTQINRLPWVDDAPKDLRVGWYIRAKVAPVDVKDIVYPYVFSKPTTPNLPNTPTHQQGWIKVTGLKINPANIDLKTEVSGFIGKTIISSKFLLNKPDEKAVIPEYKSKDSAKNAGIWTSSPADAKKGLIDLGNKDKYTIRLRAKEGFIFDPADTNLPPGMRAAQENDAAGKKQWYLYYLNPTDLDNDWTDYEVSGLQEYLNVEGVTFKKPLVTAGVKNYEPMTGKKLINGLAKLVNPVTDGFNTIRDINDQIADASGTPFKDKVGIRYILQKIDVNTGQLNPEFTQNNIPTNLHNGDMIRVELYSKDKNYKLSSTKSVSLTVSGLPEVVVDVDLPQFVFTGEDGKGSVFVSNAPPSGMRWEFAHLLKGQPFPADGSEVWLPSAPIDLSNGDEILARMVSVISGTQVVQEYKDAKGKGTGKYWNVISKWTPVVGLKRIIDLSQLRIKIFDPVDPWKPKDDKSSWNYAFKLDGTQDGGTGVQIIAPIYVDPSSKEKQLLDTSGQPVPYADKLAWEFAVDDKKLVDKVTKWNSSLPQGLRSNKFIHVRIAVKPNIVDTNEFIVDDKGKLILDPQGQKILNPNFGKAIPLEVKNFRPMTFKVPKLLEHESINTSIIFIIMGSVAGGLLLSGAGGTIYFFRARKKVNFKSKVKL